jgi:hypothetical protein
MAKYFNVSHGLRGCYMPDGDPYIVMVRTRRELKEVIAGEANNMGDMVGLTKAAIARLAANAWHEAQKPNPAYLPHCLPCHDRSVKIAKYSYGIFVSVASRSEYLERQEAGE